MSTAPKPSRTRVHARIPAHIRKRLKEHCAARGISTRAGIEIALTEYLDNIGDAALIMKRLDRLGRGFARMHRESEIFMESFMVFVKLWFAHTPPVAEDTKADARASAEARYKQFVSYITDQLARGHRAFEDFPREDIADLQELARILDVEGMPVPAPAEKGPSGA